MSRRGVAKFHTKYRESGTIGSHVGSGRPSKITKEVRAIVEEQMQRDS